MIAEELRRIQAPAKNTESQKTTAPMRSKVRQKSISPLKPLYLLQFPWYAAIIGLLGVIAVIYQFATLPVMTLILGVSVGLGVKYAIDRQQWIKQIAVSKRKIEPPLPSKKLPTTAKRENITYPNWSEVINLQTSSIPSEAQIGISEKYFLSHLQKYFPNAALGRKHPHPEWQEEWWYSSDIEIILGGLGLQLEIDEPYEGKEGRPHHCCDDPGDKRRDAFFLKRNWIIIRFAERQIVEEPIACCKLAAQVVADLTGDDSYLKLIGQQPPITKMPAWTKKEAQRMFKINFRHQYLKPAGLLR